MALRHSVGTSRYVGIMPSHLASLVTLAEIFGARTAARAEADVQHSMASFITLAPLGLGESHVAKVEQQTGDGTRRRIDIALGRLIVEVKKDLTAAGVIKKSEPQLEGYLRTRRDDTGDEYAGIVTDGVDWRLYTLVGDELSHVETHTLARVDSTTVDRLVSWLDAVLLTGPPLKPTPARIEERLGASSPRYKLDRARLEALYEQNADHPEVALKRQLWARLLRTALGTAFEDDAALFVDHTLLVVEAEIIAHLVVGLDPLALTLNVPDILSGAAFHGAQIANVVEPDFFDWPAAVDGGDAIVSDMIRDLRQFDWSDVQHDVLKHLYEAVITPETRKSLGEYYTPDWLAKRIVDTVVTDPLNQRTMDPACGSGTFVFHAVRRFLDAAENSGISNSDALDLLTSTVFGMDIHPVSVVLARVTYLLAISPARLQDRGPLSIPVHLGDSIQWGRSALTLSSDVVEIEVDAEDLASVNAEDGTLGGLDEVLRFPMDDGTDPTALDLLISDLGDLVATGIAAGKPRPKIDHLLTARGFTDEAHRAVLTKTFTTMYELAEQGRNHIWAYFARNQLQPLWLARNPVDVLVGNPPWVSYRFMTAAMQRQFRLMSEARGIWAGGKVATQQDLVALFITRSVELFLRDGGQFAFVTPYAVLSRLQYEGFRTGRWYRAEVNPTSAKFAQSWDLADVRPHLFPVPAAVVLGERAEHHAAMTQDVLTLAGSPSSLKETVGEVIQLTADDVYLSPYQPRVVNGATIYPRPLFLVTEPPAGPLGQPAGTTHVRADRSTDEKAPWKHIDSLSGVVESEFVRDVLLGSSIAPYLVLTPKRAVVPIAGDKLLTEAEIAKRPLLSKYWQAVAALWEAKKAKSSTLSLRAQLNYQNKITRQLPGASQRVIYSKSGNRIAAAHLKEPSTLIDHKLYWIAVATADEAGYLVCVLNSDFVAAEVEKRQSRGLMGGRDIDMLPWRLAIPNYDAELELHARLAGLGQRAAEVASAVSVVDGEAFTTTRRRVRDALQADGVGLEIEVAVGELLGTPSTS